MTSNIKAPSKNTSSMEVTIGYYLQTNINIIGFDNFKSQSTSEGKCEPKLQHKIITAVSNITPSELPAELPPFI